MMFLLADSAFFKLVERIDPDFLGVIGLISVVLTFVLLVVSIVTISRTIQRVAIARMHKQSVNDLLSKGYTVDEVQQLTGMAQKSILSRFFDSRSQGYVNTRPTPPVKPMV